MCAYLTKCHPDFKDEKVHREAVYKSVFPGKFDDLKMRHLTSLLLKTTEEFLVVEAQKEEKVLGNILLMQEFRKLKLSKHFAASLRKTRDIRDKEEKKGIPYFYHSYRIEEEIELFASTIKERRNETNLQKVSDELDAFYVTSKLKQICKIFTYQHLFNQNYELKMMDEILDHLKANAYENPVINIYYYGFLTLQNREKDENFYKLKEELINHKSALAIEEFSDGMGMARNYAIHKVNNGRQEFVIELLDLYKLGLETGILLDEKGELSPSSFKNILGVGLKAKEVEWLETFVKKYSKKIPANVQDSYRKFAWASLHFEKKKFQETIYLLNQIDYIDIFMMLDAKTALMKSYYELSEYDALESLLESFNQLLIRKKILGYHKEFYRTTSKVMKQLLHLSEYDKEKRRELREKIEDPNMRLQIKDWVLEKLAE